MPDLKTRFDAAVAASKTLAEKPDNATLLQLYAFYKQATQGDAPGERPGMTDMVGRFKWDAWHALQGQSTDAAMQGYLDLFASLEG